MKELPEYPKVSTNDMHVLIKYEDGTQELWSEAESSEEAEAIAEKLELGMRVIKYVSLNFEDNVSDIRKYLESIGVQEDVIEESIAEGLYGISVQHYKQYWSKPNFLIKQAKLKDKNESSGYLFEVAVLLRERENYFRDKRESVEALLRNTFDNS